MKIDEIPVWESFVEIAKQGSFSRSAEKMRVSVPQLSKRMNRLEQELGVRLFQRTTRKISLTSEGQALFPKVVSIMDDLKNLENEFESQKSISGTIRMTCVPFLAQRVLVPVLKSFGKHYPDVEVELDLSEKIVDLIDSQIDLALRIQEPRDSNLIYKKLASNDLVLCATPKYLKQCKFALKEPQHLLRHNILMLDIHRRVTFRNHPGKLGDFVKVEKIRCQNGSFLADLAQQDFGILVRSIWDVREQIEKGKLVRVLEKYPLESFGNIHAVIPSRKFLAPRVRVFLDFIMYYFDDFSKSSANF